MAKLHWLTFLILILVPVLVAAQDKTMDKPISDVTSISSQEFDGFDKCRSTKLSETKIKLITSGRPIKKEEGVWTYAIKSEGAYL